jgi:hypothetical protein
MSQSSLQGLVERILVSELIIMVKSVLCYYHLVGLPEPDVPVVFHILVYVDQLACPM